jgi:hypothetical protein
MQPSQGISSSYSAPPCRPCDRADKDMAIIDEAWECDRDWDWYAVDTDGYIAHFTSAGLRALPLSVKQHADTALALIAYFEGRLECSATVLPSDQAKREVAQITDEARIELRLRDYIRAARRGLFSYDTEMVFGDTSGYYLIASPEVPLRIDDLPSEIRSIILRVPSTLSFASAPHISEMMTLRW